VRVAPSALQKKVWDYELDKQRVLKQAFMTSFRDPQMVDFFLGEEI
jgi:hypothetical protein